jgi:FKBP-type peptidyl-prolyl cis-trans isomerase
LANPDREYKESHMKYLNRWLLALIAAFALAACERQDSEQQQDTEQTADSANATQQAPATQTAEPQRPQEVPAPENVAAAPADAQTTPNGVAYIVLEDRPGDQHPTPQDTVTVHYTGWTTDGRMFDSSVTRGEPATFPLGALIPGWQEAVPLMTVGDKYRFWIPGKLAYDASNRAGAPKGTLVFDIELIEVQQAETPDDGT